MNKKIYFGVSLIVVTLGISSGAYTYGTRGNRIGQMIEQMKKNIQKITDEIDEMFSDKQFDTKMPNGGQPLTLDQEKENVVIKVMVGEEVNKIDASMKNNRLAIDIPEKNQKVLINYNPENRFLSVSTQRSEKRESKKESTRERYTTHSSTQIGQTLERPVNLEKTKIDYEKDTLIISIENSVEKKEITKKIIEVNIK